LRQLFDATPLLRGVTYRNAGERGNAMLAALSSPPRAIPRHAVIDHKRVFKAPGALEGKLRLSGRGRKTRTSGCASIAALPLRQRVSASSGCQGAHVLGEAACAGGSSGFAPAAIRLRLETR
jgi:hypothetical protein